MSSINFNGLVSGLDTSTMIDQLVAAEKASATVLRQRVSDVTRQGTILDDLTTRLLGVRDTVVAVNRMDLVDWREDDYTLASAALVAAIAPLGLRSCVIVPVSAGTGANVRVRAEASWWTGTTSPDAGRVRRWSG